VRVVRRAAAAPALVAATLTATVLAADLSGDGARTAGAVTAPRARVVTVDGTTTAHRATTRPLPRWCTRPARACVDTHRRVAWLVRGREVRLGPVPVALGRPGHRTPRGRFTVEWKAADWTSTEYGLPMPWSVFFAAGGIAFHAGPLDERSHGCVHLRPRDAKRFFTGLDVGAVVVVR
jgi:hypothetical protein